MVMLLELKELSRNYGHIAALRDFNLQTREGEFICVQGPNGAGKTSLLSAVISRARPDKGTIIHRGRELRNQQDRAAFLGETAYLGHDPGLFFDLTALENLRFFLKFYPQANQSNRKDLEENIMIMLRRCSLSHRCNDTARIFSRGMKQRLGLARVFLQKPALLLLDEPLTGLDAEGEIILLELLKEYKENGGAAIYVTHDERPFKALTDRFVFLGAGRLKADIPHNRYDERAARKVRSLLYPASI